MNRGMSPRPKDEGQGLAVKPCESPKIDSKNSKSPVNADSSSDLNIKESTDDKGNSGDKILSSDPIDENSLDKFE